MKKSKSIIVTVLVAALLAAVVACLYALGSVWATVIIIALAVYGYCCGFFRFAGWLSDSGELTLPMPKKSNRKKEKKQPAPEPDAAEPLPFDYDSIFSEVRQEGSAYNAAL